jgi:integrase
MSGDDRDEPLLTVETRTLRNWISRVGDELAAREGDKGWQYLSMHDLRRTWATNLGAQEVDPLIVLDWGGWSDLETFLDHYRGTYSPEAQAREREKIEWL